MSSHYRRVIGKALPAAVATFIAVALIPLAATPSSAEGGTSNKPSRIGLYGQQDPTYDAVYRQGLAILALTDHGAKVDRSAIRWLFGQQCDNGRFVSFRTKLNTSCTGSDSNATAMAAMALAAVGREARAKDAVQWLVSKQLRSGGWGFTTEFEADSNSTGLVAQALIAVGRNPSEIEKNGNNPFDFLRSVQLRCDDQPNQRGALDFQRNPDLARNDYATAQAAQALARTVLPVAPEAGVADLPSMTCNARASRISDASAYAAGYLGRRLNNNAGLIPSAFGPGSDFGATMNAVLALVASGYGSEAAADAVAALEDNARDFVLDEQ